MSKCCRECNTIKPLSDFNKDCTRSDGHQRICRPCTKLYYQTWRNSITDEKYEHIRLNSQKWRADNKLRLTKIEQQWRADNKEHVKELNKQWLNQNGTLYRRSHKAIINARNNERRARKLNATPKWFNAEKKKIQALYEKAQRLTFETGRLHHVDHIDPLCSDQICGLHCLNNLQILPAIENMKKGNSFKGEI